MGFNSGFKVLKCYNTQHRSCQIPSDLTGLHSVNVPEHQLVLVFKLSPCCSNDKLSSGYFPGVWVLKADVSEHCVSSIFNRWWSVSDSHFTTCWRWKWHSVPKRRLLILRRRGSTQKTIYHQLVTSIRRGVPIEPKILIVVVSAIAYSIPYDILSTGTRSCM